jgi:hypothetical protein
MYTKIILFYHLNIWFICLILSFFYKKNVILVSQHRKLHYDEKPKYNGSQTILLLEDFTIFSFNTTVTTYNSCIVFKWKIFKIYRSFDMS